MNSRDAQNPLPLGEGFVRPWNSVWVRVSAFQGAETETQYRSVMSSRFPMPPFPSGWFRVATSADVSRGAVKPLRYFGKDLVVSRGEDGKAHVLDAHCPHMGAHLGYGGK